MSFYNNDQITALQNTSTADQANANGRGHGMNSFHIMEPYLR